MTVIDVKILDQRLGRDFPLPQYATKDSAGMDLSAMVQSPLTLRPGSAELIPTGLSVHVKDPAMCAVLLPRSGLGHKKGLVLGNLVGLIDADYQGPLMISAWNRSNEDIVIEPGMRIAQMVILPVVQVSLRVVDSFEQTIRGEGGFGSSGA